MNQRLGMLMAVVVLGIALPRPARADHVRLRSGKVIEGVLADSGAAPGSGGRVRMWIGPAQIALPVAQIDTLTTDSAGQNLLIDARYQFEGQRLEDGAQKLGQAAVRGAAREKIAEMIDRYGDALGEAIPQLTVAAREGLGLALAALQGMPAAGNPGLAVRRLNLHAALDETGKANTLLSEMGPNFFRQHPAEGARLAQALTRMLDAWAKSEDFASGQPVLALLQRVDPRHARDAAIQFYLQWGSCERRSGRYESALRIYVRSLLPMAPDVARQLIETTLKAAEEGARERNQLLTVIELYENYALKADPAFAQGRLALIWHDEGLARMRDGKLTAARDAFNTAEKYQKGSAARELLQCEWRERRAKLRPDDTKEHFELGQWCLDKELHEAALIELGEAARSPALAAEATAKAETARSRLAEARLAEIMVLYDGGKYSEVVIEVGRFMRQDHPAGYLAQAKQILDMTNEALRMRVAQRPQQAESLYRQAERAYYEEDYAKAKGLLETIATHYADTVTSARANALAALVEQRLTIAALEAGRKPAAASGTTSATRAALNKINLTSGTSAKLVNFIDQKTSATARLSGNAPVRLAPAATATPAPAKTPAPPAPSPTPAPNSPPASKARSTLNDTLRQLIGGSDQ